MIQFYYVDFLSDLHNFINFIISVFLIRMMRLTGIDFISISLNTPVFASGPTAYRQDVVRCSESCQIRENIHDGTIQPPSSNHRFLSQTAMKATGRSGNTQRPYLRQANELMLFFFTFFFSPPHCR